MLWSDASGDAMGGYNLDSGAWWGVDFDEDVRNRLHQKVEERDDLSINVLESMAMVVTAWTFIVLGASTPQHAQEPILMRGDSMSAVHWVNHCRGGKAPRSGTLMHIMGCLETGSGWCFQAKRGKGLTDHLGETVNLFRPIFMPSGPTLIGRSRTRGTRVQISTQEFWPPVPPPISCRITNLRVVFPVLVLFFAG